MNDQASFTRFLTWEQTTRDTIDFKTIYVDMADDLIAGLMLSQIVYWHLPNKEGRTKLRVRKGGHLWVAKGRKDWYGEIRVTPKQVDRALGILEKKGIVVTALYKFNGAPTKHIRIDHDGFLRAWNTVLQERGKSISTKGENPSIPKVEMDVAETVKSLTETTSEITAEQEPVDTDFWGDDGKPKRGPLVVNLPENPKDVCDLGAHTERVQAKEGNWAAPPEAGGDDPWADVYRIFGIAFLPGIDVSRKPDRESHTRKIQSLAVEVHATPAQAGDAIRAVAQLESWMVGPAASPFKLGWAEAFQNVLISDPEQLQAQIKANGGTATSTQPVVIAGFNETPDWLIPGQAKVTRSALAAAFNKKGLEREAALAEMEPAV